MSGDILVTAGFDGYIKHANPAFERTLGWTAEDVRTRPYLELVHPDDRERTAAEAAALAGGNHETRDFELRFAHRGELGTGVPPPVCAFDVCSAQRARRRRGTPRNP